MYIFPWSTFEFRRNPPSTCFGQLASVRFDRRTHRHTDAPTDAPTDALTDAPTHRRTTDARPTHHFAIFLRLETKHNTFENYNVK